MLRSLDADDQLLTVVLHPFQLALELALHLHRRVAGGNVEVKGDLRPESSGTQHPEGSFPIGLVLALPKERFALDNELFAQGPLR